MIDLNLYYSNNELLADLEHCKTINEVLCVKEKYLKNSKIENLKLLLKSASIEQKKELGLVLTTVNKTVQSLIDDRIKVLQQEQEQDIFFEFDPSFFNPEFKNKSANLHPLTHIMDELVEIFTKMNFEVAKGPLVEDQWHNFTSLNMGQYHPARSMQDTFYLQNTDSEGQKLLLRTQTSAVQVRYGRTHKPPFKVVVPGIVFRNEDIDATHDINFYQLECMYVDNQVSLAQLKTLILDIFQNFFRKQMQVRLRPSYFPFVNPGMEGDISCPFCDGKGCKVCKETGWIECFGAGLVDKSVIANMGLDPNKYQGLAFAFGVDRMAQFRLGVSGISQFYNGSLHFLI
jgi:phenylalanyl-tRNA synthetase alpha chain